MHAGEVTCGGTEDYGRAFSAEVEERLCLRLELVEEGGLTFNETAGDDDCFGVEDVEDVGKAFGERVGEGGVGGAGFRIAREGESGDVAGLGWGVAFQGGFGGAGAVLVEECGGRNIGFQASATAAVAGSSVHADDVVADGAGKAVPTALEPAVEDKATADAGADGECHEVGEAAGGAVIELRECGGVRVVLDGDGQRCLPCHEGAEVEAGPAGKILGGGEDRAVGGVDGDADAGEREAARVGRGEGLPRGFEEGAGDDVAAAGGLRGDGDGGEDLASARDDGRLNGCASDIEPDGIGFR